MNDPEGKKFAYAERPLGNGSRQAVGGFSGEVNRALEEEKSLEEMLAHPQIRVDEGISDILTRLTVDQKNKYSLEKLLRHLFDDKIDSGIFIVLTSGEYEGNQVLFMERIVIAGDQFARTYGYMVMDGIRPELIYERLESTRFSSLNTEMKKFLGLNNYIYPLTAS